MKIYGLTALCCCAIAWPNVALAQQKTPPKVAPGYETLYTAGELVKSSQALDAAEDPGATLGQKRLALSDKPVTQALNLLQHWLDDPALPTAVSDPDDEGMVSFLSGSRALARALGVQQYVLLADGRNTEAIDTLHEGLRLCYAIGDHNLIGWLSGVAISAVVVKTVTDHLDQFSQRDCDHLYRLAQEWASSPDPAPAALEWERRAEMSYLEKAFAKGFDNLIHDTADDPDEAPVIAQLQRLNPEMAKQVLAHVEATINAAYQQEQLMLQKPYWERSEQMPNALPSDNDLAAQIVKIVLPSLDRIGDRYTRQVATARLLGCHAAIRSYRWEHNHLPASLDELKIGDMAKDPFNGQPFVYKQSGAGYQLESAGPQAR
jgi:hypothetical protein